METNTSDAPLQQYTCERCGFKYEKSVDYTPFLCYRCMRFISKSVFKIMSQIQPPTSRPIEGKDL